MLLATALAVPSSQKKCTGHAEFLHTGKTVVTIWCMLVQEAKLLDAKSRNNMYFIEYTVKKPSQEEKHLLSAIALGFNGRQVASAGCCLCDLVKCEVCSFRNVASMLHTP